MPISKEDIPFDEINFNDIPATREQLESWIEKHGDKLNDIRELWLDLDVKVLSTVENPSHDSNVVRTKEDGSKVREVTALKSNREKAEEKQIIVAPAMVANEKDKDGDVPPSFVVEEAAHNFLKTERVDSVDSDHETPLNAERSLTDRGTVVESWVLEDEKEFETVDAQTKTYGGGDWMVAIELEDETWERFEKGELTGISIMGVPEKKVEFKSNPIQSEDDDSNMTEESENKMPDADEIRSELEQYNVDTSGMNDEDLMEFAKALHDDLMEDLTDEEDMDGDDEDDEEEEEVEEEVEQQEEAEEENLDDPAFSEGDAVMWSSNDTPVHGRVNDVHEQYSPAEGVTITGEEGEAVYSIFEYDDSLETPVFRNSPSNPNIAKPESSLSESQMDMPPASEENFEVEEESEEESEQVEEQESEEVEEEQTEEESEEKAPLEGVAMMMADHIPDLSEEEALTMLERMDGDEDTAEEVMDSYHGDDEEEEEEEESEEEEKSKGWQDEDSEEVEKDEIPAWLRDDINRKVSVKEQESEKQKSDGKDIPDWIDN